MDKKEKQKKAIIGNEEDPYVIIGGFMSIGMGIGFLMNNLLPFMFIGLGIGLLVNYVLVQRKSQK